MDTKKIELIEKLGETNAEVKALWEQHLLYEKQLEKLTKKTYRTPQEDHLVTDLKKKKLAGKTKLQKLLDAEAGE